MTQLSLRPGKGAVPYDGGVTFRTWAPYAAEVRVVGEFAAGSPGIPMAHEGDGWWSCDVAGAAAGQKYSFSIKNSGDKIDPYARHVTSSAGKALIKSAEYPWKCNDFRMPPWEDLVIYEMHIGTFPDDPPVPGKMLEAVLAGNEIGYLKSLGINAVELLPAHEFPGDTSWGYNPAHVFAVESAYGGPEAFKKFVDTMHLNGIAVILDVVYNHLGPADLPVWRYDGWGEFYEPFKNYRNGGDEDAKMGGIYFYNDWRADTPWGHKNRPDFGRPEVRAFFRDNAMMWLEEFRVDGLRFDSTIYMRNVRGWNHVPPEDPTNLDGWGWNLMRWINDEVRKAQPWKITIAEDLQGNEYLTKPTPESGAGFGSQWDAGFVHPVRDELKKVFDEDRDLFRIKAAIESSYNAAPTQRVIYTESHDEVARSNGKRRLPVDIHESDPEGWAAKKRSTLGAALVFTSPGIPMIFQGQEILDSRPFGDDTPMDWDRCDAFEGIYRLYGDLIGLRRNLFNHTRGLKGSHVHVYHCHHGSPVLAYHRWAHGGPGDDVVVILNFSHQPFAKYDLGFPGGGVWRVRFNSDSDYYDRGFDNYGSYEITAESANGGCDGMPCRGSVAIGAYGAIILSQ